MSGIAIGLCIFGFLLTLMVCRVPIGIAMFFAGAGGSVAQSPRDSPVRVGDIASGP